MTTKTYIAAPLPAQYGIIRYGILNTVKEAFVANKAGRVAAYEEEKGAAKYAGLYNDGLMVE